MATASVRLPDEKHERLNTMAKRYGISLNRLFEELSTTALADFDIETRCNLPIDPANRNDSGRAGQR